MAHVNSLLFKTRDLEKVEKVAHCFLPVYFLMIFFFLKWSFI